MEIKWSICARVKLDRTEFMVPQYVILAFFAWDMKASRSSAIEASRYA